nr:type IV secretion system protein [Microvirga puerhi]
MTQGVESLADYVNAPLKVAAILYVTVYGFMILRGATQGSVLEFAFHCIKLAIVITLATNVSTYNTYVTHLFFDSLPKEIGNALASGKQLQTNTFDLMLDRGFQAARKIWAEAGITNPGPMFVATLVMGVSVVGTGIAYFVSLYAKLALAFVLAIGPVFIALALFQQTRNFTQGWLGQVANFVVLQVLVVAVLLLVVTIVEDFTKTSTSTEVIETALIYCVVYCLTAVIAWQLPGIASALAAGGASLSMAAAAVGVGASLAAAGKAAQLTGRGAAALGNATQSASNRIVQRGLYGRDGR